MVGSRRRVPGHLHLPRAGVPQILVESAVGLSGLESQGKEKMGAQDAGEGIQSDPGDSDHQEHKYDCCMYSIPFLNSCKNGGIDDVDV